MEVQFSITTTSSRELRSHEKTKTVSNLWTRDESQVEARLIEPDVFYDLTMTINDTTGDEGMWELQLIDPPEHKYNVTGHNYPQLVLENRDSFQRALGLGKSLYLCGAHGHVKFRIDANVDTCGGCDGCEAVFLLIQWHSRYYGTVQKEIPLAINKH